MDFFRGCDKDPDSRDTLKDVFPRSIKQTRKDRARKRFKTSMQKCTDYEAGGSNDQSWSFRPDTSLAVSSVHGQQSDSLKKPSSVRQKRIVVQPKEIKEFLNLTDHDVVIQSFLKRDSCMLVADKYLLAMVFAYFKRANFSLNEYTRLNFFIALYLAHDVEEDEEDIKYEIFPWILGVNWRNTYMEFLKMKDILLRRIDYKAIVSRRCCDEIMALVYPNHSLWQRERPPHHAGAIRAYLRDESEDLPRGPTAAPRKCPECSPIDSQYDSASSVDVSYFISSEESSLESDDLERYHTTSKNDKIWPSVEE